MTLRYDSLGYAHCDGHWIHKPQVVGEKYYVFEGSHPHDPDGDSCFLGTFPTEGAAKSYAKNCYIGFLEKELKRLRGT